MVLLIPGNANPTRADIDAYLHQSRTRTRTRTCADSPLRDIKSTVREIECKSGAGALLHPAEEYFLERATISAL
jgi:hypothetical protein